MSQMSELDIEIKSMTYSELEQAWLALKNSPSKGVRDEALQEFYARELERRENMCKVIDL
jgi:hypothetical protein